ncbi:xylosyltransferase oxt-like [Dreissena polymorpha]|uniref:EGF-like domain-containing protein n=1 Tax=Dreissena polymorpha TaxID=45954 RepID=A0A9D4FZF5_DREPO|nr:xylosyltransferase oxt-like [Dreissena polymorpha]XP_052216722.1 xylosyltransferase oxt-like [Dreissena polymorpha]XP_052216723.1 xylosyltransferase oxt-like [Dreissena polymorpha]KAH3805946.1 hypothetical protein DPMN_134256 [Dreissena polymorpha]
MFVYAIISSFIVAIVAANCVPNPCQNGGTCFPSHEPIDTAKFSCKCTSGWDGRFCTIPFRSIGCYKDSLARIMTVRLPDSNSNSPLECAARCHGYPYSGTQFGIECFCGDCLNATKSPDSECNMACPGDNSKKCGGNWRMSVHSNRET